MHILVLSPFFRYVLLILWILTSFMNTLDCLVKQLISFIILLAALLEYKIHTVVYFCYNAPHRARQQFLTAQGSTEH